MARLLRPSSSPLESWIRTATWYQLVRRWATACGTNMVAALDPSLVALRDALEAEAVELQAVYAAGTTAGNKRVAGLIAPVWAEVKANATEPLPGEGTGMGGLGANPVSLFEKVKKVGKWIAYIGGGLLALWAAAKIAPTVKQAMSRLLETQAERIKREIEEKRAIREQKRADLSQCQTDCGADVACLRACVSDVNKVYALIDTEECGMLDTPTGTALGGILGLLAGYVAAESVLGWVE